MFAIGRNCVAVVCSRVLRSFQIRGKHRLLATFDFDNTIIDGDCYEAVGELLKQSHENSEKLCKMIEEREWIKYIRSVLNLLHQQQDVSVNEIVQRVRQLPEVPGMMCLLRQLGNSATIDMCILSDANSLLITEWLKANNLANIFAAIFTNPARVCQDGFLQVSDVPYMHLFIFRCLLSSTFLALIVF